MQKKIRDFLPSRRFIKSLGIILGIIVIIGGIGFLVNRKAIFSKSEKEASPIVVKDIVDSDSDNDGLPDWKETLWGLDPSNRDTDGDGIYDGDELDIIQKELQTPTDLGGTTVTTDSTTKTDQFAEQIVQLVSALQGSGQLTNENQQAIVEQIVAYGESATIEKKYSKSDIKIVTPNSTNIDAYVKKINDSFARTRITQDDINLLIHIDPDQYELLQGRYSTAEKKYAALVETFKSIPVPETVAYEHIEFMNGLYGIESTFSSYQLLKTDPILMLQKYASLENTLEYFRQTSQNLLIRLKSLYTS